MVELPDDATEAECEREDCQRIAATASDVYCQITGGLLSYPTYDARTIIAHADEQTQKLVDEECARVRAETVADERQRIGTALAAEANRVADVPADATRNEAYWAGRVEGVLSARSLAAGSVPVATPAGRVHGFALSGRCVCGAVATPEDDGDDEPLTHEEVVACLADARGEPDWVAPVATPTEPEPYRVCAGCDGPDLCKFCGYRAATPTEPLSDELLDKWAAAVTLPGECAAQLVDEVRRLRAAVASPVPAEQPEER